MVTSVRNQKNCGACWAISVVELIESVYAIKTGLLQTFSVQEVGNLKLLFFVSVQLLILVLVKKNNFVTVKMYNRFHVITYKL